METKRVAIGELEGAALDFAVANAARNGAIHVRNGQVFVGLFKSPFRPTKNWSQCGPLIERYKVDLSFHEEYLGDDGKGPVWEAMLAELWLAPAEEYDPIGKTPLIAACRAIVASHNPDGYVDVPVELLNKEEGQ